MSQRPRSPHPRSRRRTGTSRNAPDHRFVQPPWQPLRNPYPPTELVSADQLEAIHDASLTVLEELGINFLLPEARQILKAAGADVDADGPRVRFDRTLLLDAIAKAPSQFTLHARNPAHNLRFGGNQIAISSVSSPPNCSDIERGRRSGNFQDYCDFLRLTQSLNIAHLTVGHPVEPIDIDPAVRHLDSTLAKIELTDKLYSGYSLGRQRILDVIEMTRIARGLSEEQLQQEPSLFTNINANSPRQYDKPMLWGIIEMAQRNQAITITPFTLAGAMAPITLAGALVQQNAEALAGIAFVQLVNPGTPVLYGGFTSNVDMKTGSPAFGTPENAKAVLIGGQLARRYKLPYRSSNVNASNAPDAQAVYESMMSVWSAVMGHANLIHHGLGWLEGGLTASFEKFIIDAEIMQHMAEFLRPIEVTADELALDAIRAVEPGGHYFATPHTLERFETAFYRPILSDWRNFESWSEDGALDATQRAHRVYKKILAEYQPPALEPARREKLQAFVARRKQAGGAPQE
ncbi:MAG: trimethylamine methyltransferase family protein [Candidatus Competibacteraceae bacterium]|nr:trimethylamine methyltransferase family protein [Candidatus Competibacteraceae bacterium]MCB1812701.1 trimethylamine methyltransferase family protein [Candidatus Competibacteraceae bacterium]